MFVLGLARVAWFDDPRVLLLLVVLVATSWIGDRTAFMALPGNTTDGTLQLALAQTGNLNDHATCTWSEQRDRVIAVSGRRNMVAAPHSAVSIRLAMPVDGAGNATLEMTALAPVSFEPVSRYSGQVPGQPADPTGRQGQIVAASPAVEVLPAAGVDPALADFVRDNLRDAGAEQRIDLSWECPQLP
jgi:hypothetical protein